MFELSRVRVTEWFLWESISEGSAGIQKQFELLEVQVIGDSSYQECTVIPTDIGFVFGNKRSVKLFSILSDIEDFLLQQILFLI